MRWKGYPISPARGESGRTCGASKGGDGERSAAIPGEMDSLQRAEAGKVEEEG